MDGNFSKQEIFLNSCLRQAASMQRYIKDEQTAFRLFSDTDASEQQNGECVTDPKKPVCVCGMKEQCNSVTVWITDMCVALRDITLY